MDQPRVIWRNDIKEHVNFGCIQSTRIQLPTKTEPRGQTVWEISGAHNSHNFLRKVAEFPKKSHGKNVLVYEYKDTWHCHGDEDKPTFRISYKVGDSGKKMVKSLYNPRCFSEDRLYDLAGKAFDEFCRNDPLYAQGGNWEGTVEEQGQRFMFSGLYEVVKGNSESVLKINTYYLTDVY